MESNTPFSQIVDDAPVIRVQIEVRQALHLITVGAALLAGRDAKCSVVGRLVKSLGIHG